MVPDDLRDALDLLAAAAPPTGRPAQERPSRTPAELACWIVTHVFGPTGAPAALDLQGRYTARLGAISAFGAIKSRDLRETVRIARSIGLTREEISEAVFQPALFGEFASAIGALSIVVEVFSAEDEEQ